MNNLENRGWGAHFDEVANETLGTKPGGGNALDAALDERFGDPQSSSSFNAGTDPQPEDGDGDSLMAGFVPEEAHSGQENTFPVNAE